MSYLRFYPILLIGLATVILAACGSSTRPSAQSEESASEVEAVALHGALASVCYLYEKQSAAATGVVQDLAERELTNAEIDQLTIPHERAYEEKYPPPASAGQLLVHLFTYCDFASMTDEQQTRIVEATKIGMGQTDYDSLTDEERARLVEIGVRAILQDD